ncbi:hypothetical protein B4923_09975 [Brenneria roseae subsp. americana]|uniref:Uncharacterized protein n=1 Tax=Brenneria roseae subsp. americana TaxID=1508507 RepID=A0A2U1TTX3_9GAMM|nr:hypothetical protein [Brenneria roseae]PWC12839.1 hypothetical protein B4923_09975 [Brenneria roseae subsp. americana]
MIHIQDNDTDFRIYPVEKIKNKGAEDTPYDSWLDMYVEIKSKGLDFNAKWGCFVCDLIELHTQLLKLKASGDESIYLFSPDEGMLKLIFGKNELGTYYVTFTIYTDIRSDVYVHGISGIDIPSMDNLINAVHELINY